MAEPVTDATREAEGWKERAEKAEADLDKAREGAELTSDLRNMDVRDYQAVCAERDQLRQERDEAVSALDGVAGRLASARSCLPDYLRGEGPLDEAISSLVVKKVEAEMERDEARKNAQSIGLQVAAIEHVLDGGDDPREFPPVAVGKARRLRSSCEQKDREIEGLREMRDRVTARADVFLCVVRAMYDVGSRTIGDLFGSNTRKKLLAAVMDARQQQGEEGIAALPQEPQEQGGES